MTIVEWAQRWKLPPEALKELCETCLHVGPHQNGDSESIVQAEIRLAAARTAKSRLQTFLWRNNRGAGKLANGNFLRWGLANDSKGLGDSVKSGDLIGGEQIQITPDMVGSVIMRFLSIEVKRRDWKFAATAEELAQVKWATIINSLGGRAII